MTTDEFLKIQEIFEKRWNLAKLLEKIVFFANSTQQNTDNWNSISIPNQFELYLDNDGMVEVLKNSITTIKNKIAQLDKEFESYKTVKVMEEFQLNQCFHIIDSPNFHQVVEAFAKVFKCPSDMK